MTRHCYDTTVLIDLLRGKPKARRLIESHEGQERSTTAISVYELSLGATSAVRERAALELLGSLSLLPLGSDAAWEAGQTMRSLRRVGKAPPLRDLLVGSIAREAGCRLYTSDQHFPLLESLDLEVL